MADEAISPKEGPSRPHKTSRWPKGGLGLNRKAPDTAPKGPDTAPKGPLKTPESLQEGLWRGSWGSWWIQKTQRRLVGGQESPKKACWSPRCLKEAVLVPSWGPFSGPVLAHFGFQNQVHMWVHVWCRFLLKFWTHKVTQIGPESLQHGTGRPEKTPR